MKRRLLLIASAALLACSGEPDEPIVSGPDASLIEEAGRPDATEPDASPTVDAGADADAGPSPDGAVFADDFEDGDPTNDWDVVNVCPGCSLAVEQGTLVAKTKAVVVQDTAYAHLRTTVMGNPTRVRLSFDATFPSVGLTKGSLAIATVDVSLNHFFSLFLRDEDVDAPAASLVEQGGPSPKRHLLTALPPANTKTRVVVDIDLGGGTASVSFGGTVVLANDPIGKTVSDDPTIRVGLIYVFGPQDPFEARFDDVLLEYF